MLQKNGVSTNVKIGGVIIAPLVAPILLNGPPPPKISIPCWLPLTSIGCIEGAGMIRIEMTGTPVGGTLPWLGGTSMNRSEILDTPIGGMLS